MSKHPPDSFPSQDSSQMETLSKVDADSIKQPAPEHSSNQIGHYRLVKVVGAGGMGEVYEAEQLEPVRRKVALKLIRLGMNSEMVLSRFEMERQSLAMMNHVNIAQIYDGGVSEQGRPYFVMEYVDGIPIDRYCDEQCLETRQRLKLFQQVCEGIQHAHQKGIIHRDIKPSNVLVEIREGKAVPKIIDFGVAKATHQAEEDATVITQMGQIIGTPMYMSPEQVKGLDIDTRTDVYALGVLLYELLAGIHPLDYKRHPKRKIEEILKKICEEDPSRPSVQVSTLVEDGKSVAEQRGMEMAALARELRGDLDWITMKALEKERERRYNSPSELAADIERYLKNEPVLACPPSTGYRIRKFVRRHRIGVATAAVVSVALLAGITGTTIGMIRAVRAEKAASEEAENARQVSDFLVGLFEVSDPSEARGNTVTAREILDKGVEKIEGELERQPAVKARMMLTMGNVYSALGLYDEAEPLLDETLSITRSEAEGNRPALANALLGLANLYKQQAKYNEGLELAQEALSIREETLGPEHPDVATAHQYLGIHLREMAKYDRSLQHLEKSLEIREKTLGSDHLDVAMSLFHMGWLYTLMEEHEKAIDLYERALAIRERNLPEDHPTIASNLNDLGTLYSTIGSYDKALELLERSLAIREKVLGREHSDVATSLDNLGSVFWYLGKLDEAEHHYERALAIREKALGTDHPDVARSLNNLALTLRRSGRYKEALPLLRRALEIKEESLGSGHPDLESSLTNLALLLADLNGDQSEIEDLLNRALSIQEKAFGSDSSQLADAYYVAASTYSIIQAHSLARSSYRQALNIRQKALGLEHPDTLFALSRLSCLEAEYGNPEEARTLYKRILAIHENIVGSNTDEYDSYTLDELARLHLSQGHSGEARDLFEKGIEAFKLHRSQNDPLIPYTQACYSALLGDRDQAIQYLKHAIELGYSDFDNIDQDADLESLRDDQEFKAIIMSTIRK